MLVEPITAATSGWPPQASPLPLARPRTHDHAGRRRSPRPMPSAVRGYGSAERRGASDVIVYWSLSGPPYDSQAASSTNVWDVARPSVT